MVALLAALPVVAQRHEAVIPIATRALATLSIPGYADFLAADGEMVWVTNDKRVELLRRDAPRPIATVAVPAPCGAMVTAFGALWVANCSDSSVYRIDLTSRAIVARIKTGLADTEGELSLAAGAGSIWVLSDAGGTLTRVDHTTNAVAARIAVAPHSYAVAFGFGSAWVTNTTSALPNANGSVQRVDPGTNRVVATIAVGDTPRFLAAGEGAIWTLNQRDGTVSRVDPLTNTLSATIDVGMKGSGGDIDAGGGVVWVRGKSVLLSSIDAATNRVRETFGPPSGSGAVRVAGRNVWVTAHDTHRVWVMRAQ